MIEVQEINSYGDLEIARSDWDALARRVNASVFLSHGWFLACAGVLEPSEGLKVLILRESGRVTGIAPMMTRKTTLRKLPLKQIGFLDNQLTPFCDFLFEENESGVRTVIGYLLEQKQFDVLHFNRLLPSSSIFPVLKGELERQGLTVYEKAVGEVVYLRLTGDWDQFYNAKSRKFRMTRRSVANKISRLGQIQVECAEHPEQLQAALADLLELSAQGWKRQESRDLLGEDVERRLLTALVEWGGREGMVRIWLLRKDKDVIAAEFHIVDGGTAYGLRAQYDPQYFSHSPGRALDYEIVERLFKAGLSTYDMGPGVAEYKRNWSDDTYPTVQIESFSRRLYPQLVAKAHYQLAPAVKKTGLGKWLADRRGRTDEPKSPAAEKAQEGEKSDATENEKAAEKECPTVKSES